MSRRKYVQIDIEDFKKPIYIYNFTKISDYLKTSGFSKVLDFEFEEVDLAMIVFHVKQFMETNFGRESSKPRAVTIFPAYIYKNFSVDGPLVIVLKECLKYQNEAKASLFTPDAKSPEEFITVLQRIQRHLVKEGHVVYPKVYLKLVPREEMQLLKSIITSHGGSIVKDEMTASHVIEWYDDIDMMPEELNEEYVRPLEIIEDKNHVRVHWLYYPDSYENIITRDEVDVDNTETLQQMITLASSESKKDKWRLCCRYIKDCEVFNEWCNEHDYEVEEKLSPEEDPNSAFGNTLESPRKSGVGRKKSRKRNALPVITIDEKPGMTENVLATTGPSSITKPTLVVTELNEDSSITKVENNEAVVSAASASNSVDDTQQPLNKKQKLADNENKGSSTTTAAATDSSTTTSRNSWYQEDNISTYEKEKIGKLLLVSDTVYMEIRNKMIQLYQLTPHILLSATESRKKISGDVNTLFLIHAFLEEHQLINNEVASTEYKPNHCHPIYTSSATASTPGIEGNDVTCPPSLPIEQSTVIYEYIKSFTTTTTTTTTTATSTTTLSGQPVLERQLKLKERMKKIIAHHEFDTTRSLIIEALKMNNLDPNLFLEQIFQSLDVTRDTIIEALSKKKDTLHTNLLRVMNEYLVNRLQALDQKVQLLSEVESSIDENLDHIQNERKDLHLQRVQLTMALDTITR